MCLNVYIFHIIYTSSFIKNHSYGHISLLFHYCATNILEVVVLYVSEVFVIICSWNQVQILGKLCIHTMSNHQNVTTCFLISFFSQIDWPWQSTSSMQHTSSYLHLIQNHCRHGDLICHNKNDHCHGNIYLWEKWYSKTSFIPFFTLTRFFLQGTGKIPILALLFYFLYVIVIFIIL